MIDSGPAFQMRLILDVCRLGRGWKLAGLVDWLGYGSEERSWVPLHHILDKDIGNKDRKERTKIGDTLVIFIRESTVFQPQTPVY